MNSLQEVMRFDKFIDRLTHIVLDNLSNEQFGVESLAQIYGISRSQLFKKIKHATGKSASQFIRDVKLEEAFKRLRIDDLTIAQVAHDVGFSSHAYFATCFKDYYGYAPSEVKLRESVDTRPDQIESNNKTGYFQTANRKWQVISAIVLALILALVFLANAFRASKINKEKTVAVIRFVNMTDNENNQLFADGLAEEILNSLSKIGELKVSSRTSSFQFDKSDDIKKIANLLNVNYVLEGSVRKENNTFRVTTQLIDANDGGFHLWSETFDRKHKDILFLQEEIARVIAHELEVQLTEKEDEALQKKITSDSTAYKLYSEGIRVAKSNKIEDIKKGVELMKEAINKDSLFSLAHARIVDLYKRNNFVGDSDYKVTTELMKEHVDKALKLDPTLAEAYIAKGFLEERRENYVEAMNSFKTAVELAPNEPRAHLALAGTYTVFNRAKERYSELEKAFELDPLNPRISLMAAQYFYYNKRDFNKGIEALENSISAFPDNDLAKCHLAMYRSSLPKGDLVGSFKSYFEMYRKTPDDRRVLNWLANCTYWLDLKPMSEMLNNKMRLGHPKNIHTFWNMYASNGLHGRYTENVDLVKFWSIDQNLKIYDQINYIAESYINSDKPELAKQIIEDSLPDIDEESFLLDAEKYNSLKNVRLDIIEKYIITLREFNETKEVARYLKLANTYIDGELERLSREKILDYRYGLYLNLVKASVEDDVEQLISVFDTAFFDDKHRIWMYDELVTFARYHRFKEHPKFISFLEHVTKETHVRRDEVISYLKQEGFWEASWDQRL